MILNVRTRDFELLGKVLKVAVEHAGKGKYLYIECGDIKKNGNEAEIDLFVYDKEYTKDDYQPL